MQRILLMDIGENRWKLASAVLCLVCVAGPSAVRAQSQLDISDLFTRAIQGERTGLARKTKPVDARPARPGEKVVTFIAGEGKETQSPPAEGPLGPPDDAGWSTYRPRGNEMLYFLVQPSDGTFTFKAPWGELMIARPGDAIVRDPKDPQDTYRVAAAAFDCTYEIEELPKRQ